MSKPRPVFLAVICVASLGAGQRVARAETRTDQPDAPLPDGAQAGVPAATVPLATPPKKHTAQISRRPRPLSSGFVPQDRLAQMPLARPSGHLHLVFPAVRDEVDVNIFNEDGTYDLVALERASHVLRCRRTDEEKPIAPQLLVLLSHVEDHFGGRPIEIVSGYRNQRKMTSNHYKATATDIRIAGVPPRKLREFAETLDRGGMGIGLYPRSGFVHIDVRSSPSYRWIDYSPPGSNAAEKRPPRGWRRKKLQS